MLSHTKILLESGSMCIDKKFHKLTTSLRTAVGETRGDWTRTSLPLMTAMMLGKCRFIFTNSIKGEMIKKK